MGVAERSCSGAEGGGWLVGSYSPKLRCFFYSTATQWLSHNQVPTLWGYFPYLQEWDESPTCPRSCQWFPDSALALGGL